MTNALIRHAIARGLGPEKVSSIKQLIKLRDNSPRCDVRISTARKLIDLYLDDVDAKLDAGVRLSKEDRKIQARLLKICKKICKK